MGERPALKPLALIDDEPVRDFEQDRLGLRPFAQTVAETALGSRGPFTIGVYGAWGVGKTSLLSQAKSLIDASDYGENIITVWFNAWQYEKEENLIVPLLLTIAREIDSAESSLIKDSVKGILKEISASLKGVSVAFSIPGLFSLGLSPRDANEHKEKLEDAKNKIAGQGSLYFEAFDRLKTLAKKLSNDSDQPGIIVFIDDLDRALPDRALKLLEGIKLALAQPGFVFALALNPEIIKQYLRIRFEDIYGIKEARDPDSYLDKIIQLRLPIPPHETRFEKYITTLLKRDDLGIDKQARESLNELKIPLAMGTEHNPRSLVRLINNLIVDQRLFKFDDAEEENDEKKAKFLHICAVSRILQMHLRSDPLFHEFSDNIELCEAIADREDRRIESLLPEEAGSREMAGLILPNPREAIIADLCSRPFLIELLKTEPGLLWLKEHQLRREVNKFIREVRPESIAEAKLSQAEIVDRAIRESLGIPEGQPITEEDRKNVKELKLILSGINDEGFAHLSGLTNLQELWLNDTKITNAGLAHLKGLKNLWSLGLDNTKVTDAGLAHLKGLTNLQTFGLKNTKITDAGLAHLKGLTNLQELGLSNTQVTDSGLAHLEELTNLQVLLLYNAKITDAGLAHLNGLENLKVLGLQNTNITDAGLANLKGLTSLLWLGLQNTNITDAGLANLKGLTKYGAIWLSDTKVTQAGVEKLKKALPDCHIYF